MGLSGLGGATMVLACCCGGWKRVCLSPFLVTLEILFLNLILKSINKNMELGERKFEEYSDGR